MAYFLMFMVARAGVQPATFALGVRCSMQLSYRASYPSVTGKLEVEKLCLRLSGGARLR